MRNAREEERINTLTFVAVALIVLGFGQLAAGLSVYFRHAIPRSPWFFRWLTLPSLMGAVTSAFVLAWLFLTGADKLLGLEVLTWAAVYLFCAAWTWWSFVAYAVYHWRRMQREQTQTSRNTETLQVEAKYEAEDRFSEGELEKTEVRGRLDDAAEVAKDDLEVAVLRLEEKLDEVLKRLGG